MEERVRESGQAIEKEKEGEQVAALGMQVPCARVVCRFGPSPFYLPCVCVLMRRYACKYAKDATPDLHSIVFCSCEIDQRVRAFGGVNRK